MIYPIGTVSSGTMREEDLVPDFVWKLRQLAKRAKYVDAKTRREHRKLCSEIEARMEQDGYYESDDAAEDLNECLFDALDTYAAPYFYFGSHPGDGSDYGFWLIEDFEESFDGLKVEDLADVPKDYRGEVAVVNDHGNVTLYSKSARKLTEVWAIV